MQVSIHEDREDCDLSRQGSGSINSSSTLALDSRLVLIIHFWFTTRKLHGSVNWLLLDPFWASGIASVHRGDLPIQQFGDSAGDQLFVVWFINLGRSLKYGQTVFETLLLCISGVDQRLLQSISGLVYEPNSLEFVLHVSFLLLACVNELSGSVLKLFLAIGSVWILLTWPWTALFIFWADRLC